MKEKESERFVVKNLAVLEANCDLQYSKNHYFAEIFGEKKGKSIFRKWSNLNYSITRLWLRLDIHNQRKLITWLKNPKWR